MALGPPSFSIKQYCIATVDGNATVCNARVVEGLNWCPRHNEERIKLYGNYKSWQAALEVAGAQEIFAIDDIRTCSSIETIREWSATLRSRYNLLDRCIRARARFTERFFGNDMDFGHRTFWLSLLDQRDDLEALLAHLEGRGYDLLLESQDAAWLRDQDPRDESNTDCAEHDAEPLDTPPADSPRLDSISDLEATTAALWTSFRRRIATYMLPTSSRYYEERKQVIWAWICRAVVIDSGLTLLASTYTDVPTFLADPTHGSVTVLRLRHNMKRLCFAGVWAAVNDVFSATNDEGGEFLTVMGTRLYRKTRPEPLPFHIWGHLFAVFPRFPKCKMRQWDSVASLVECARYALLTGSGTLRPRTPPPQHPIPGYEILGICGILVGPPPGGEKHITVTKRVQPDKSTIWEEEKRTPMLLGTMSATHPKAHAILNALLRRCLSHTDLDVILRKRKGEAIIRSGANLGPRFSRTASSLAGLRQQPWAPSVMIDDDLFGHLQNRPCDSQFVVLHGAAGAQPCEIMIQHLLVVCMEVYGVSTIMQLCHAVTMPYVELQELELAEYTLEQALKLNVNSQWLLPNRESALVAYTALWGPPPKGMEDRKPSTFRTVWPLAEGIDAEVTKMITTNN
ncbi:hypothetical protein C8R46DRAFT_1194715 [Mycena filopes]|nr:hypothetical protein C8R46DRAFT_1194715 [Mycena filopes]